MTYLSWYLRVLANDEVDALGFGEDDIIAAAEVNKELFDGGWRDGDLHAEDERDGREGVGFYGGG